MSATNSSEGDARAGVRRFGRLQLLRLLGKSRRTMAWLAAEPDGAERMLVLPRLQPPDRLRLEQWLAAVRRAARLAHPQLAPVRDIGVQDGWPYVLHELGRAATLVERRPRQGLPAVDAAAAALQALRGLAFAHEAGVAHHDPQPWLLLQDDGGQIWCAGLAVGAPWAEAAREDTARASDALRAQREAAERDVLALGIVLHGLLGSVPALGEPDVGVVVERLPPLGRDFLRLGWEHAHPIAEPLRAIVDRATSRHERQRYRNARTLIGALEGWLQTEAAAGGGTLALLEERLRAAGTLPAAPGAALRMARLARSQHERTSELAEVVLEDTALAFELLRAVNGARRHDLRASGSGAVLTVRRAIALVGIEGLRQAAGALRPWPGPLDDPDAAELERVLAHCRRAGHLALALRPAGYDGELAFLVTLLQALGRLVVHYHFADEARQIRRLMQPVPAEREGESEQAGMGEEAAACAVLGVGIQTIGAAVARGWGLDDAVLTLIRPLPLATPVRSPENDDEVLRALASCAHEAVDALALPAPRVAPALQRVVQRYGRALGFTLRELHAALHGGGVPIAQPDPTLPAPLDEAPAAAAHGRLPARQAS